MGNGVAAAFHKDHVFLGIFHAFADSFGNFTGLAHADADIAFTIADCKKDAEAESLTALHRLADAVDENYALVQLSSVRRLFFGH